MKTETFTVNVYEVGDVVEINTADMPLASKRRTLYGATRAMVVHRAMLASRAQSYKLIADNGKSFSLRSDENGIVKWLAHVDLEALYGKEA